MAQFKNNGHRDVEIVITEFPRHDWLIRGVLGDELALDYLLDRDE